MAELDMEEKKVFLADLGREESGLDKLIKASYSLLGLISYLTAGPKETKAWTITKGTKAPQAAGKIHSDFERGFIRAEVVAYNDLIECGSHAACKTCGKSSCNGSCASCSSSSSATVGATDAEVKDVVRRVMAALGN